jgi:hypothetical protein
MQAVGEAAQAAPVGFKFTIKALGYAVARRKSSSESSQLAEAD